LLFLRLFGSRCECRTVARGTIHNGLRQVRRQTSRM